MGEGIGPRSALQIGVVPANDIESIRVEMDNRPDLLGFVSGVAGGAGAGFALELPKSGRLCLVNRSAETIHLAGVTLCTGLQELYIVISLDLEKQCIRFVVDG